MSKNQNPELVDGGNAEWKAEQFAKARPPRERLPQIFDTKVAQQMLKLRPPACQPPKGVGQHPLIARRCAHFKSSEAASVLNSGQRATHCYELR